MAADSHSMISDPTFHPSVAGPPPRVLVVTGNFLFPEHDGGSQHMLMLLVGLVRAGCMVTYFALAPHKLKTFSGSVEEAQALLTRHGIAIAYPPERRVALEDYLKEHGPGLDYVLMWPEDVAMQCYPLLRQYAPQARVIFNTIDLSHVRLFRKAKVSPNLPALQDAIQAQRREAWLTKHCDTTLVVSEPERQTLAELSPGADIRVIPSVWSPVLHERSFAMREGLLFVGSFPYEANVDAVLYFVEAIYPIIRRSLGDISFYIVGAAPPPELAALSGSDKPFIVTGQVPSVEPYFERARVCIAPVRYGAGIKTKSLYSMSCGLPVVTSTIGAEGLHVDHGESALIADDPLAFARATMQLYQDQALWLRIAAGARAVIADHFSGQALDAVLGDIFKRAPSGETAKTRVVEQAGGVGD